MPLYARGGGGRGRRRDVSIIALRKIVILPVNGGGRDVVGGPWW